MYLVQLGLLSRAMWGNVFLSTLWVAHPIGETGRGKMGDLKVYWRHFWGKQNTSHISAVMIRQGIETP